MFSHTYNFGNHCLVSPVCCTPSDLNAACFLYTLTRQCYLPGRWIALRAATSLTRSTAVVPGTGVVRLAEEVASLAVSLAGASVAVNPRHHGAPLARRVLILMVVVVVVCTKRRW